jgi:hypothetical protein
MSKRKGIAEMFSEPAPPEPVVDPVSDAPAPDSEGDVVAPEVEEGAPVDGMVAVTLKCKAIINGVAYGPGEALVPVESFEVWRHAV